MKIDNDDNGMKIDKLNQPSSEPTLYQLRANSQYKNQP